MSGKGRIYLTSFDNLYYFYSHLLKMYLQQLCVDANGALAEDRREDANLLANVEHCKVKLNQFVCLGYRCSGRYSNYFWPIFLYLKETWFWSAGVLQYMFQLRIRSPPPRGGEKRVIKHLMEELQERFLPQTRPVCGTVLGGLLLNGKQKFIRAILIAWIKACFSCMLLDQPIRKKYFITRCHGVPRPNIYCTCRCTQFKCRCGIFVLSAVCSHRSIHSFFCEVCFCCLITSPRLLFGLFVRLHDSLCLLLW